MGAVSALVMVEGLPGSGKSTTSHAIAAWLADQQVVAEHWAEGRTDHPVDFEQVAVLSRGELLAIAAESPQASQALLRAAEPLGDAWVVREQQHAGLPPELVERLRLHDAYDGDVSAELHSQVLTESWRRFGATTLDAVHVWECVLLQNPVCALVARADQPVDVLARHVAGLVDAVRSHAPALVYLDAGDPLPALERAASERPAEWLDFVVAYHTRRGLGLRCGLSGFEGYVEFMRRRREMELEVLDTLDLPMVVVPVGDGRWHEHEAVIRTFVAEHLGLNVDRGARRAAQRPAAPEAQPVA